MELSTIVTINVVNAIKMLPSIISGFGWLIVNNGILLNESHTIL